MNSDSHDPSRAPATISVRLLCLAEACRGRDVTLAELASFGDEREDASFLLVLLLSLPFCQPVPLAGLSTPFGLMLGALGWGMFRQRPFRLPAKLARVRVPHRFFPLLIKGAGRLVGWMERHLRRRREGLARSPGLRRLHGACILFWALMLALPLPIPFSNIFSALPLPLLAAGLLEDDGVMVLRSYLAGLVCLAYWLVIIFFGAEVFTGLLDGRAGDWLHRLGALFP